MANQQQLQDPVTLPIVPCPDCARDVVTCVARRGQNAAYVVIHALVETLARDFWSHSATQLLAFLFMTKHPLWMRFLQVAGVVRGPLSGHGGCWVSGSGLSTATVMTCVRTWSLIAHTVPATDPIVTSPCTNEMELDYNFFSSSKFAICTLQNFLNLALSREHFFFLQLPSDHANF